MSFKRSMNANAMPCPAPWPTFIMSLSEVFVRVERSEEERSEEERSEEERSEEERSEEERSSQ